MNEPKTMEKFTLKLHTDFPTKGYWVDKFDEIISLDRNFQSIDVNADETHAHSAVELFVDISSHHGNQIRSLTLHKAVFKHSNDFCEILRNLPNLEFLEVSRTKFDLDKSEIKCPSQTVALAHLKTVKVVYSSWVFLQFLAGSKITSLIMTTAQVRKHEREVLIHFLEDSDKLTFIEIGREAFEIIFEFKFENDFPFYLRKIKFFSYTFKSEFNQVDDNFIIFLESQSQTVEDLEFEYASREILETIFTKLVHLKRLKLNANTLPLDKEFYDQMTPFDNLREFHADDRIPNEDAARGMFINYPNLEMMSVNCDPHGIISNILPFIASNNPKLRFMSVDTMKVQKDPGLRFRHLEVLHVFLFKKISYLVEFLKLNSTIHTLNVKWIYDHIFIDEVLDKLMNETKLKHLKFGGRLETMKAVYDKIKMDSNKLKSLELTFKTDNVHHSLFFDLPPDPTGSQCKKWEAFGIR